MRHSVLPDLSASPRALSCGGGCKVHNSHCCICSSGIFPYYSIYNGSLVGFCGCFTSYIVLANDYVKHLYFYYLPTPVITGIDHIPTLLLNNGVLYSSTCQQPGESQSLLYPLHSPYQPWPCYEDCSLKDPRFLELWEQVNTVPVGQCSTYVVIKQE